MLTGFAGYSGNRGVGVGWGVVGWGRVGQRGIVGSGDTVGCGLWEIGVEGGAGWGGVGSGW